MEKQSSHSADLLKTWLYHQPWLRTGDRASHFVTNNNHFVGKALIHCWVSLWTCKKSPKPSICFLYLYSVKNPLCMEGKQCLCLYVRKPAVSPRFSTWLSDKTLNASGVCILIWKFWYLYIAIFILNMNVFNGLWAATSALLIKVTLWYKVIDIPGLNAWQGE